MFKIQVFYFYLFIYLTLKINYAKAMLIYLI